MPLSVEEVLRVVEQHGPVIPNQIKQRLGQSDSTLINVYLSGLCRDGRVKMTDVKLGSSKFYYTQKQQDRIGELVKHLNEKDRRTAQRLRSEGVIRASTADPLTRVGLKNIPDFARPITVKTNQGEETFYRWYALDSQTAQERIREVMGIRKEPPQEQQEAAEPETEDPVDAASDTPSEKKEAAAGDTPTKKEPAEEPKRDAENAQVSLERHDPQSDFGKQVLAYFADKDIVVRSFEEVRKGSEADAIVQLPTAVGRITYFCKAKSKKNSNDGDLAAAILSGKAKMLPVMYLTTGRVTDKAKENPELGEVTVVEIGSSD